MPRTSFALGATRPILEDYVRLMLVHGGAKLRLSVPTQYITNTEMFVRWNYARCSGLIFHSPRMAEGSKYLISWWPAAESNIA